MKNRFVLISLIVAITLAILSTASFTEAPKNASGPGAPQGRPGGQQILDTAAAAEKLGITEEALIDALGDPDQGPPDFAAAAETLGITEADLLDAFMMENGPSKTKGRPGNLGQGRPGGQQMLDTAAAAEQLGITEEALIDALGDPTQGPPDFAAAAETLGITEANLLDELGITIGE